MRWYAAKTKAGQDAVAVENLRRQYFETYYPQVIVGQSDTEPLFPGYVLIRFELETASWRSINNTRGIVRLLSFAADGNPSPLPEMEIIHLKLREHAGTLRIPDVPTPKRGDTVRMAVGPYVDQIGEVVRTRGERVEFLMLLLGRKTRCIAARHTLDLVGKEGDPPVR